nr:hypothetical protein [Streptomyces sp. DSM 41633]
STEPADWVADGSAALQDGFNARDRVVIAEKADGPATIETYTVRYDWTPRTGIIIGRLNSDGSRFLATTTDEALMALLTDGEPLGASIVVQSGEKRNAATLA